MEGMSNEKAVNICVFCGSHEGYICAACVQKILLMTEDQLRQAYALAVEKGYTEKAEILESYMEEIFDEGNNVVAGSTKRSGRFGGVRYQKKPARPAAERKRISLR